MATSSQVKKFSVSSMNIGCRGNAASIKERVTHAIKLIKENKKDIVFLQEVTSHNQFINIKSSCKAVMEGEWSNTNGILWNKEMFESENLDPASTVDINLANVQRFCHRYLKCKVTGVKFLAISFHGHYKLPTIKHDTVFAVDYLNVFKVIHSVTNVLVGGDFNISAKEIKCPTEFNIKYTDATIHPKVEGKKKDRGPIDYFAVLSRGTAKFEMNETPTEEKGDVIPATKGNWIFDHQPIYSSITITKKTTSTA